MRDLHGKKRRSRKAPPRRFISVQYAAAKHGVPHATSLRKWALTALQAAKYQDVGAMCIRIVNAQESRTLNARWRGKDKSTNVLSFPYADKPAHGPLPVAGGLPLGDIVVCASVVAKEAQAQSKLLTAHWAHMVVHGVLHLLGYDHEKPRDALQMEALEVEILQALGFSNPYLL